MHTDPHTFRGVGEDGLKMYTAQGGGGGGERERERERERGRERGRERERERERERDRERERGRGGNVFEVRLFGRGWTKGGLQCYRLLLADSY